MTPPTPLDTVRLRLEPWSRRHLGLLARLSAMPAVTRYVGTGEPWEPARVETVAAAQVEHWRRHGFGWRVAVERETGDEVGFMALNFTRADTEGLAPGEYEIGWWLDPAVHGRGYGREGGAAIRDEAFGALGAPSVVARVQPGNRASRNVAEALGLSVDFETKDETGVPVVVYRLSA
jgi:RimJ/RimL family protein N-acetyltransferase